MIKQEKVMMRKQENLKTNLESDVGITIERPLDGWSTKTGERLRGNRHSNALILPT